ncbi:hypothetical protein WBJ53_25855 [Spirosoma sp. SC4-14]|uniref:hypothetical protein n=1 Tax=Spirosoma sp. SC4-14 TaxID=3128900 RepID=UPI0030D534A3
MFAARSFWLKFSETFCLFLVIIGLTQLSEATSRWQFEVVSDSAKRLIALAILLGISFLVTYSWERIGKGNQWHTWLQTIITVYVAYSITGYGAAKILKTQFQAPQYIRETPIGELNGFWLTWTYYGYSQTMAYILGWTQVLGCVLLLFRRTQLMGVVVLLPVMINIDLIDHFYDISPLAYYNALHYTFLLFFLLLLDYDTLKAAFLSYQKTANTTIRTALLTVVRLLVIGLAFWRINSLRESFQQPTKLNGVWKVESLGRNNSVVIPSAYQDSVWSKVYFEWRYGCLFKYHPDKFQQRDLHGDYKVDEATKVLTVHFPSETGKSVDSMRVSYQFVTDSTLTMRGRFRQDSLTLKLKRLI